MRSTKILASVLAVFLLVSMAFQPAVVYADDEDPSSGSRAGSLDEIPAPFRELDKLVAELIAATTDTTDTDGDSIPDRVEWVIGTDPGNPDSDFDLLNDMEEVQNRTDPLEPDSNKDGIPDSMEFRDGVADLDSDGVPNAWDGDNDGDGLADGRDMCPFASTEADESFHFNVKTSGAPATLQFQLRTSDPAHMRLVNQAWDWPYDLLGNMRDLDDSTEDVTIAPILELNGSGMPDDPELAQYGIVTAGNIAYIPLYPIWQFGDVVALQGQMFYPEADAPRNLSFDMRLSWKVTGATDKRVFAFRASDGRYLSAVDGGPVCFNASEVCATEEFEMVELDEKTVAIRAANGLFLSYDQTTMTLNPTASWIGSTETLLMYDRPDDRVVFRTYDHRCINVSSSGDLRVVESTNINWTHIGLVDMGVQAEPVSLAVYPDRFSLTGFVMSIT